MGETLVARQRRSLTSYLPPHVLRRLASGEPARAPYAERFDAAVLLADIRGFTRMTEQMAARGPDGVELFTDAMNRYFGGMIDCVAEHGGEVVSFAGDALLAVWPADQATLGAALDAAAGCALVLATRDADVAAGVDARLRVRLAVAAGEVVGLQLGRPTRQIYCALMGRPLEQVSEAIAAAEAGEVATDAAGWELLRGHAESRPADGGARVISAVNQVRRFRTPTVSPEPDPAVLAPYIAPSVLANEAAAHGAWIAELRRVTAIFVDLPDLVYDTDLDHTQELIVALQADFERHETQLNQIGVDNHGTSLLAAAGLPPHAHADDPERGIRTALAVAETLRRLGWRGTVGVASGRALCVLIGNETRREYMLMGDSINVAARLSTSGDGSERVIVLCDDATADATRRRIDYGPPVELTVKGKTRPITAYRPLGRRGPTTGPGTAAFGRRREQRALLAAIEAGAGGASRAIAIEAEPGLGKSHLLAEAAELAATHGMRCFVGAGDAIEQATPYHGWRHVFAALLEIDDRASDAEREQRLVRALGSQAPLLNPVLGLDLPDTPLTAALQNERRIQVTREFLLTLLSETSTQPLLIAIDDAHWLDSASWALLREFVRRGLPGLTLIASRPTGTLAPEYAQLLEEPGSQRFELAPLSEDDALDLAAERLGAAWLGAGVSELILDRAAGNPLFVEEIARALADAGVIKVDATGTCMVAPGANLQDLGLPDTVEGVIANRMEGLEPRVDLTLKVSSVIGPTFAAQVVHDVYPLQTEAGRLDTSLDALVRRDLTQVLQPPPATSYSFRHALIRDVAYQRLLFGQRRALHRAIGEWHEQHFAGNLAPVYATLAHHYTRAGDVERACDYLGRASVQAINNGMGREAVDLGLAAAAMLGVELPRAPADVRAAIGERLRMIGARMAGRSIESLAELPPATDPVRVAAIGALLQTAPAAFISQQSELFALIGLEGFRLTLETGSTPYLPGVLALYALLTRSFEPDPRPAFALSSLAERLAERDSPPLLANAGFVHSWFVHHWLEPIPAILPRIPARAAAGFEHGDVMMGCFNTAGYVTLLAASGAPLDEVIAAGTAAGDQIAGRVAAAAFHCVHEVQFAKALAGRTTGPCSLTDAPREGTVDEQRDLASIRNTDLVNQQGYYLTSKLRLHFYYRDHVRALAFGDQAERVLAAFRAQQQEVEFVFFHGLALLAHARETGDQDALARGVGAIEQMRSWAHYAPDLFAPRVAIMEGELAWARGNRALAAERFTAGAEGADRHHAALARELAGRCLLEAGRADAAREQLRAAVTGYREWGAAAKVDDVVAALG